MPSLVIFGCIYLPSFNNGDAHMPIHVAVRTTQMTNAAHPYVTSIFLFSSI